MPVNKTARIKLGLQGLSPVAYRLKNIARSANRWRLHFETGHQHSDFPTDRMTASGRDEP
jgi:hypothetical protein